MKYIFSEQLFVVKAQISYAFTISVECSESILVLEVPKLIRELNTISSNTVKNIIINSELGNVYEADKKYQPNNYEIDKVDIKKSKNKVLKKKRMTSSSIITKGFLSDNQDDLLHPPTLSLSELKVRKNRKKNKNQINNLNSINDLNVDIETSVQRSLTSSETDKRVIINNSLTVSELSVVLSLPEAEIIRYLFLSKSIAATINHLLDIDIAKEVAEHYDFIVTDNRQNEDAVVNTGRYVSSALGSTRSTVVTILGHVDHGKTTLLDAILKTNLVKKESGGITQRISAYEMSWFYQSQTYNLIFLDTPGHQSFRTMRLRGAKITDIALLIISITDGVMSQTVEAINYIKQFDIACIVVVTKVDTSSQDVEFILSDLSNYDIVSENWGGDVPVVEVSAIHGKNIDMLLSKICVLSRLKNFTANVDQLAIGTIIDSYLDKKQGPIAYVLVQDGMLRVGDTVASGGIYGKVKRIIGLSDESLTFAAPSSVVQVLGFSAVPTAGLNFQGFDSDKQAKQFCLNYSHKVSDNVYKRISNSRVQQNYHEHTKQLKLIIKADTQGSLEAIVDLLATIPQLKVQLSIISASFSMVTNSDISLAATTDALILAFNSSTTHDIINSIKKHNIMFRNFHNIYEFFDYVQTSMLDLVELEYEKVFIGRAIVRTVFNINKGCVAGCYVSEGKLVRSCHLQVYRKGQLVYEGVLDSLKRLKNDVNEVLLDNECGIMCSYNCWQEEDSVDAYDLIPQHKSL